MMGKGTGPLLALQLLAAGPLVAQAGIESLFPARPTGWVTDRAGILDPAVAATVEARLNRLRDSTGGEIAVVTLPTVADYAPADVATAIGRGWGVGTAFPIGDPRRNAAAVLLLVPRTAEHRGEVFIGSGDGAEGFLTDARAGQIRDAMLPDLRQGNYSAAVDQGTSLLTDLFARELGSSDSALVRPDSGRESRVGEYVLVLAIIVVVALFAAASSAGGGSSGWGGGGGRSRRSRGGLGSAMGPIIWGSGLGGGRGGGGGFGGGGFGGFGGGGGFSGGGAGGSF
jgi:uncharacterized protein